MFAQSVEGQRHLIQVAVGLTGGEETIPKLLKPRAKLAVLRDWGGLLDLQKHSRCEGPQV